jgi:hypothetical protein
MEMNTGMKAMTMITIEDNFNMLKSSLKRKKIMGSILVLSLTDQSVGKSLRPSQKATQAIHT